MENWTGEPSLDRVEEQRTDPGWVASRWREPDSRLLVVGPGGELASDPATGSILLVATGGHFDPQRHWLLGMSEGTAVFATPGPVEQSPVTLREVGHRLSTPRLELATAAVGLAQWHHSAGHCERCGARTLVRGGGFVRHCPGCGRDVFPRTDPAVIVAVVDPDNRLLLGRQARWPAGRRSLLAGFVAVGESLEQAVRREVREESGVGLGQVRYLASQPWPFPRSLMVGFVARAVDTRITVDGEEIVAADWHSRDALEGALVTGRLSLPNPASIAHRIVASWRAGRLPAPEDAGW